MACATLTVSEKDFLHQNIYEVVTEIRSINKRPDLKNIHSHLAKRDNLQELSIEYLEQQISELEKLSKLVSKKFKGEDSYYIVNTHSTEDILQSQEPFISYIPSTPSMNYVNEDAVDDTTKFYAELKEIKTKVMALQSFILEQFHIIKQKTKATSEASQCRNCSDNRELVNTLLHQTEVLRKEIFSKNNIIFNLLNTDNKHFNNIQNISYKSINDKNGDKSYENMGYEIK